MSFESDIRQAQNAVRLIIDGVLRRTESEGVASHDDVLDGLFTAIFSEMTDWTGETHVHCLDAMHGDMQSMIGDGDCPSIVRELLTKYNLNP